MQNISKQLGRTALKSRGFYSRAFPLLNIKKFPTKKKGFENKALRNIRSSDPPIAGDYALPLPEAPIIGWRGAECSSHDNVNKVALLPASFTRAIPEKSLPRGLESMYDFLGRPVLFVRGFIVDLISFINTELALQSDKRPVLRLALDGQSMIGKSSALHMLAAYYQQNGHVVLFAPNMWRWVGGWHAYQPSGAGYEQPKLVASYLDFLLKFHKLAPKEPSALSKIPVSEACSSKFPQIKNAEALVQYGVKHEADAELCFELFLDSLAANKGAVPVLAAIDQANCLYTTTWYSNPDGEFIMPHKFRFLANWMKLLSGDFTVPNSTVVFAGSKSLRQSKAPLLEFLLEKELEKLGSLAAPTDKESARLPNRQQHVDLSSASEFAVVVNYEPVLDSPYFRYYQTKTQVDGVSPYPSADTKVFTVPFGSKQECFAWMTWLDQSKRLNVPLQQNSLEKQWSTSGGVFGKFYAGVTSCFY